MIDDLKPCPFCGGIPKVLIPKNPFEHNTQSMRYAVCCCNCSTLHGYSGDFCGMFSSPQEAVSSWNRRFDDE